jgi:hypothetical protein
VPTLNRRENARWGTFSRSIDGKRLMFQRIEALQSNGVPDVILQNLHGTAIWIENKCLEYWPKRAATAILPPRKFEGGQLGFLRGWEWKGGHAFVLAAVEDEFFLIRPIPSLCMLDKEGLYLHATKVGKADILEHLYELK